MDAIEAAVQLYHINGSRLKEVKGIYLDLSFIWNPQITDTRDSFLLSTVLELSLEDNDRSFK